MLTRALALVGATALLAAPVVDLGPETVPATAFAATAAALHGSTVASDGGSASPTEMRAADIQLTGRVVDGTSGQPIQGAQVYIPNSNIGALTNAFGRYLLVLDDSWEGREVTVEVVHVGHATTRRTTTLVAEGNVLDFSIPQQALVLDEVVVTGEAEKVRRRTLGNTVQRLHMSPSAPIAQAAIRGAGSGRIFSEPIPGDRESYAHIQENEFMSVASNPLSTFSIDVDRASYANVRRFIEDGMRPPVDAVRIEELINYFPYDDPPPAGEHPFTVTAEVAPAPWQPRHHLVRIGVKGREIDMAEAPANNLVFLLDVSGSMGSPDKLPLLKQAFGMLVDQLREDDRVAIVVYAGAAGLVLPSTSGSDRETIREALGRLTAGGSTAGGAGIRLAYRIARENHIEGGNNRVILATDGDFNVGASSDAEMIRLIEEKREQGTFLTVLGFGTGNLQDAKMEQIADHGNGNF
ncbi:MAG: von Willebrand factor type A domain-containing protein, partial [Longimicrobiales bacterium]|nr:von Willebrand factor type A domain-containing protein [Longimicrobiales bacterium]